MSVPQQLSEQLLPVTHTPAPVGTPMQQLTARLEPLYAELAAPPRCGAASPMRSGAVAPHEAWLV